MKKNENLDSKLQILTPNQEIFKNEEIFIFYHFLIMFFSCFYNFFFIFLARGTWNPGKPWKTMKNNGKPSKTKENEKKMKLQMKKNENLDSKLQILTPNQEICKNSRNFSFFIIFFSFCFLFFFIFLARGTWNPGKPWKTMENHQKQRKMKKNEVANEKKNENLDSKLQILTPNQEIFKNSRKFSFFYHFFIILFSFFYHFFFIFLARGTWNPGKPWKTMKNNGKPSKTKENEKKMKLQRKKKWKFGLKVADSHSEPGNLQKLEEIFMFLSFFYHFFFMFLSFFFHFPCPWHLKSRKAMKINEKQWKTIKNKGKWKKNEVANEKKWSCKWKKNEVANEKNEVANEKNEVANEKNEDKMKKMKIKWKKMMMKMKMNMNMKMKMKMKKNEKKNSYFWWSQTVAVRIL